MNRKQKKQGFTLMELLIVIAILGLLTTLVIRNFTGVLGDARIDSAWMMLTQLKNDVDQYKLKTKKLPSSLDDLMKPIGASKQPIRESIPKDPWGNEYILRPGDSKRKYYIISYGADGIKGGEGEDADLDCWTEPGGEQNE